MNDLRIEEYPEILQPHLRAVVGTRNKLIAMIRRAVEKHGCIGTFYRNLGKHHAKDQTEEEYDDSPIVVIRNKAYNNYGGFDGNTVYDIFIDPQDDLLLVTLNGEAGEDFDEPIEHVQVEGLLCIVCWLTENGLIDKEGEDPMRCENCGSTDVLSKAWIKPNANNEYFDETSDDDYDRWCRNCEGHHTIMPESNLMDDVIEPLWEFIFDRETITGIKQQDTPDDQFEEVTNDYWAALTNEEKISIWKS